jgi:hypothetical protein
MGIYNNSVVRTRALGERGLGMKGRVHRIDRKGESCSLIGTFCKKRPATSPCSGSFFCLQLPLSKPHCHRQSSQFTVVCLALGAQVCAHLTHL